MAPEIALYRWPSYTTDVFSMGVTIFQILTGGRVPHQRFMDRKSQDAIDMQILQTTVTRHLDTALGGNLPATITDPNLKEMLMKMLKRSPGSRALPEELWQSPWLQQCCHELVEGLDRKALEQRKLKPQFALPLYPPTGDFSGALPQGEEIPKEWLLAVDTFEENNEWLMNPPPGCGPQDEVPSKSKGDGKDGQHRGKDSGKAPSKSKGDGKDGQQRGKDCGKGCLQLFGLADVITKLTRHMSQGGGRSGEAGA